jgi:transposase-like protein
MDNKIVIQVWWALQTTLIISIPEYLVMPKTIKTARGLARFAKAPYASRRKSLPRHSFETRQKALAIFQAGGSYKNCAKTLNIPVYTARDWHRSFLIGTFRAEHGARQQSYTPEQKAEVLRLRKEEGKSYNVISQLTKVNRATVLQWIHKDIAQQQAAEAAAQQAPANDSEMTETGPTA